MSNETSASNHHQYGVARVCRIYEVPRSTFYANADAAPSSPPHPLMPNANADAAPSSPPHPLMPNANADAAPSSAPHPLMPNANANAAPSSAPHPPMPNSNVDAAPSSPPHLPKKRGPAPAIDDYRLLELIRHDLATSSFKGEGHRKVWARLRMQKSVHVSKKRVLRLMRENQLLSPHRARQSNADPHDGTITTAKPNDIWGTDGMRVFTVHDGWAWVFTSVEHWNGECVGHHVCKRGSRYEALEPIAQAITRIYGSLRAGVASGLTVRPDHGSQYTAQHFINQVKYWGCRLSFALVGQPQTNGVTERFNRTLREQVTHGKVFQNVEALRKAVAHFVKRYNAEWRLEKNGFMTPNEMRLAHAQRIAA